LTSSLNRGENLKKKGIIKPRPFDSAKEVSGRLTDHRYKQ